MLFLSKLTELGVNERLHLKTKHAKALNSYRLNAISFERLTESQMEFAGQNWEIQGDRFDQTMNYNHEYIFWVESYAALILATHYLSDIGYSYNESYDTAVEMWCFTTDYAGSWND